MVCWCDGVLYSTHGMPTHGAVVTAWCSPVHCILSHLRTQQNNLEHLKVQKNILFVSVKNNKIDKTRRNVGFNIEKLLTEDYLLERSIGGGLRNMLRAETRLRCLSGPLLCTLTSRVPEPAVRKMTLT